MKRLFILMLVMIILLLEGSFAASGGGTYKKYTFEDTPKSAIISDEATMGEKNALRVGEDYLNAMGFSYEGLIDQLEFEGFSHEEAVYACDILFEKSGLPIKKGSKGDKVREVQTRLKELGFLTGSVDGDFGGGTEKAVKAFQTSCGLETTGIVDEGTYKKLFEENRGEHTFIGKISFAMDMDTETLWNSASSAAFGSVTVMTDIVAEGILETGFDTIKNVFLGKVTVKGEGEILVYYYFNDDSVISAIFNPETGKITTSEAEYAGTPQQAMIKLYHEGAVNNFCIVDIDIIKDILKDLME